MAALWTVPGVNHFVIGTDRDKMGITDWKIKLVDLSTGNVTDETDNVTVAEIIYNISNLFAISGYINLIYICRFF